MFKKIIPTLLLAFATGFSLNAQTTVLSPTGDGGFENGTTFAANGWTVVNPGTVANTWAISNTPGVFAGTRCAHITNNATPAYSYTNTAARTCHMYRDITIPAGSASLTLSFQWKGWGQSGADQLLVYTAPTTVVPVANAPVSPSTAIAGASLVWMQSTFAASAYGLATISLPASMAGTTFRIIFTWQNDATGGTNPPAAIDNISFTYNCSAPAAIAGANTVCEGGSSTLTDASSGGTWSSSNPAIATVSSTGVVTGVVAGTTLISYTTTCTNPATMEVSVLAVPTAIIGATNVCSGFNISLFNAALGGTWSSSATGIASVSAAGVVYGHVSGSATISYNNGCGSAATVVSVSPMPAPIVGHDSVCVGSTTTFANSVIGGTWSSSAPIYATVLSGSGVITGVSYGESVITYSMSAPGCFRILPVTVVDVPGPIVGAMQVCPNSTISLSNPSLGGHWVSLNPSSASVGLTSGVVTGIVADVATIEYTTLDGCKVYADVTVNPRPAAIIGDTLYCAGDIDTLFDATPGGVWTSASSSVASVDNATGVMTTLTGGTAVIKYTLATGCFISRSFSVNAAPAPVVRFNDTVNTMVTDTGYLSYQWYHSVYGEIVGATIYKTAAVYNGNYFVMVQDKHRCFGVSAPKAYTVSMGVGNHTTASGIRIFPNPANGLVQIDARESVKAVVSGIDGKTLIEKENAKAVDVSQLANGVYILSLYNDKGVKVAVEKLTKK